MNGRLGKSAHVIVMDSEVEQMMHMRKASFQQKYISMVHNFTTKVRKALNMFTLFAWRNIWKTSSLKYIPTFKSLCNPLSCIVTIGEQGTVWKPLTFSSKVNPVFQSLHCSKSYNTLSQAKIRFWLFGFWVVVMFETITVH